MRGERIGALAGAIGGLVFVVVNAGALPGPAAVAVRAAVVPAFAVVVWFAVLRPAPWTGMMAGVALLGSILIWSLRAPRPVTG